MRTGEARKIGLAALGLALLLTAGCKRKPDPLVQPVTVMPKIKQPVEPAFPEPAPDDDEKQTAARPVQRHRVVAAPPVVPQPAPVVNNEAIEASQRQRDSHLLQQQEAASQRQQQELNGIVQQSIKTTQQQQAEPRIQEAPQVPITVPESDQRIQDNALPPGAPAAQPAQPAQPQPAPQPQS